MKNQSSNNVQWDGLLIMFVTLIAPLPARWLGSGTHQFEFSIGWFFQCHNFQFFFTMTWSILCLSYCLLNFLLGGLSYLKHFKNEELQENIHHFFCSASWSNTGIINLDKMMLPIMFYFFLVTIALDLGLRSHLLPFRTPQPSPLQLKLPSYPPQLLS
jgi:hypothetical protein